MAPGRLLSLGGHSCFPSFGHSEYPPEHKGGTTMSLITISRQLGSLGSEIAQALGEKLNYEYVDKAKIERALSDYGLYAAVVEKFDEKKPPFWESFQIQRRKFLHSLEAVIYDFARKGNVIILGRGGQVLLKNFPGVFHVRIIAPFGVRLTRLLALEGGDEKEATRILHRSDRDSAGFLRSFFDTDWEDQGLYDLIINTQKLSVASGVKLIMESILSPEIKEGEKQIGERLTELALAHKVEATLMSILEDEFSSVKVQTKAGTVTIIGHVTSEILKENCSEAAGRVEGVKRVDNQLYVVKQSYGT
jgi:cytidylate kinase